MWPELIVASAAFGGSDASQIRRHGLGILVPHPSESQRRIANVSKSNFAATPSRAGGSYKSRAGSAVLSLALAMLCCFTAHAAQPDAATVAAYDAYLETAAADLDAGVTSKDILWANDSPERISRLRAGEIIAEPSGDEVTVSIEGGEISDVVGAVFIPGQSIDEVLALIQDYDSYQEDFAPEITESKLISREANRFNITIKFVKTFIISIGYNVEQAVDFVRISGSLGHGSPSSLSSRTPGPPRNRCSPMKKITAICGACSRVKASSRSTGA